MFCDYTLSEVTKSWLSQITGDMLVRDFHLDNAPRGFKVKRSMYLCRVTA
jgi:hypothetical protein